MSHVIFVSYCTSDQKSAFAIVDALEAAGLACWVAPRNILAGSQWADAIVTALASSRLLVVVHSAATGESRMVRREINTAIDHGLPILPIRLDETKPQDGLLFYLGSTHWFDALPPPIDAHLPRIVLAASDTIAQRRPPDSADPENTLALFLPYDFSVAL